MSELLELLDYFQKMTKSFAGSETARLEGMADAYRDAVQITQEIVDRNLAKAGQTANG